MTRHGARILFGLGLVSVVAVFAAVAFAALTPKPGARLEPQDVGLVSFARLRDGIPERVTMHDDVGLDLKARDLRGRGIYHPMTGRAHQDELPVWVVKSGSSVRAFIAIDPRNGCDLAVSAAIRFHDVCHGSIYRFDGEHVGGPSPWSLDELVVSVRGDIVYADRHAVLPGHLTLP
jgi:Rieske Fe-S protein